LARLRWPPCLHDPGGSLKRGVYDCEAYNAATGFLDYRGSVKLPGGGRYQQSYGRHHGKLTKPHNYVAKP
jgi:hypothetical protein